MNALARFFTLSSSARRQVAGAFVLGVSLQCMLHILPFAFIRRTIAGTRTAGSSTSIQEIVFAVRAVRRRVHFVRCLAGALAAQRLLLRNGHHATLRIGVTRNENNSLDAHAWIECDGKTLLDDVERLSRFTVFPSFDDRTA